MRISLPRGVAAASGCCPNGRCAACGLTSRREPHWPQNANSTGTTLPHEGQFLTLEGLAVAAATALSEGATLGSDAIGLVGADSSPNAPSAPPAAEAQESALGAWAEGVVLGAASSAEASA